ncbi:DUF493 domain-containing protein [Flavobacterium agricola]|uniref:DUF493 domain-containing protein n=1 Tax=Flavobacterium agricola TaxID=2870839 RepID=A0ABY6LVT6_9FLAO|nr:DUF493 domain-containing protein [Flavobacterium agricola]UYW00440.1 DUF493 domain-containing protein [Flavobacterium agricola]
MNQNEQDFYKRLQEELDKSSEWPLDYLFKFIVPVSEEKVQTIKDSFQGADAKIDVRNSSTGKFTAVSIRVIMPSSQSIIDKYLELTQIEGIISL